MAAPNKVGLKSKTLDKINNIYHNISAIYLL